MSAETVDALFDEAHDESFADCRVCLAALKASDPDRVFLGRTWRMQVRQIHDQSIRTAWLCEALLRSSRNVSNGVVTYEIQP